MPPWLTEAASLWPGVSRRVGCSGPREVARRHHGSRKRRAWRPGLCVTRSPGACPRLWEVARRHHGNPEAMGLAARSLAWRGCRVRAPGRDRTMPSGVPGSGAPATRSVASRDRRVRAPGRGKLHGGTRGTRKRRALQPGLWRREIAGCALKVVIGRCHQGCLEAARLQPGLWRREIAACFGTWEIARWHQGYSEAARLVARSLRHEIAECVLRPWEIARCRHSAGNPSLRSEIAGCALRGLGNCTRPP